MIRRVHQPMEVLCALTVGSDTMAKTTQATVKPKAKRGPSMEPKRRWRSMETTDLLVKMVMI